MMNQESVIIIEVNKLFFKFKSLDEVDVFIKRFPNDTIIKLYEISRIITTIVDKKEKPIKISGINIGCEGEGC